MIRPTVAHLSCLLLALAAVPARGQEHGTLRAARGDVAVILWFGTEDFLLPASDDAAGRVEPGLQSQRTCGSKEQETR